MKNSGNRSLFSLPFTFCVLENKPVKPLLGFFICFALILLALFYFPVKYLAKDAFSLIIGQRNKNCYTFNVSGWWSHFSSILFCLSWAELIWLLLSSQQEQEVAAGYTIIKSQTRAPTLLEWADLPCFQRYCSLSYIPLRQAHLPRVISRKFCLRLCLHCFMNLLLFCQLRRQLGLQQAASCLLGLNIFFGWRSNIVPWVDLHLGLWPSYLAEADAAAMTPAAILSHHTRIKVLGRRKSPQPEHCGPWALCSQEILSKQGHHQSLELL